MNCEYVPAQPEFAAKLRSSSRRIGIPSVLVAAVNVLGLVGCGVVLIFTLGLGGVFAGILGALGAGFALASALGVLSSSNYVTAGYLNVTYARQTRRSLLFLVFATTVNTVISSLVLAASASQEGVFPAAAVVCLALLWINCAVSVIDGIVGRKRLNWETR